MINNPDTPLNNLIADEEVVHNFIEQIENSSDLSDEFEQVFMDNIEDLLA